MRLYVMERNIKIKINHIIKRPPLKEIDGVFFFVPVNANRFSINAQSDDFRQIIKQKLPKFYELAVSLINMRAIFERGMSVTKALTAAFPQNESEKIIIDIGSGIKHGGHEIIGIDRHPYSGVDVVADAVNLPFKDKSIDMVFCISLLEHVSEPEKALAEIIRVLKPGGYFYCAVPFMYPFHSAPSDYIRFTEGWFRTRLINFEFIRSGIDSGPITAITIFLAYAIALVFSFGSKLWYSLIRDFFIVLFVPFRALDILFSRLPFAEDVAASIYLFARKN